MVCNKEKQTAYAEKSNNVTQCDYGSSELVHNKEQSLDNLKKHMTLVHNEDVHVKVKDFNCNLCTFSGSRQSDRNRHTRNVHDKLKSDGTNLDDQMSELIKSLHMTAEQTIGYLKKSKNPNLIDDAKIQQLSEKRRNVIKSLRDETKTAEEASQCRYEINQLKHTIEKRIEEIHRIEANIVIESMNTIDDSKKMFAASKILYGNKKKPLIVHDENKHNVESDNKKAEIIRNWFKQKLSKEQHDIIEPFDGAPRPLNVPITPWEVYKAASKLNNDRAVGEDNTSNELFKYAGYQVHIRYCSIINKCFETNSYLKCIGEGILNPLQKPKKPRGPTKSLRPLILSNSARKLMSMITLKRIETKLDHYTAPWQCAYKKEKSCSLIVWTQRILTSVVMRKKWSYSKMGIDMTSAFNTIKRTTILALLKDAGCTEDEIRMVRFLLANTKLKVRVNSTLSSEFVTNTGTFEGDCLSGVLFTLVLAGALNHVRVAIPSPNPPIAFNGMPTETSYADDVDFIHEHVKY